jgi:protein SMG6
MRSPIHLILPPSRLVDACHDLLQLALNPRVQASVKSIPDRYNIPTRLWSVGIQKLISNLRRSAAHSYRAGEHLTEFIYWAYSFYTALWQDENLTQFKGMWLEALGDLASYRLAVAMQSQLSSASSPPPPPSTPGRQLPVRQQSTSTIDSGIGLSIALSSEALRKSSVVSVDLPANASPTPSISLRAASTFEGSDEVSTWRTVGRHWYSLGLGDTPGTGRLHHHMGHLSRDERGAELRALYHFGKRFVFLCLWV